MATFERRDGSIDAAVLGTTSVELGEAGDAVVMVPFGAMAGGHHTRLRLSLDEALQMAEAVHFAAKGAEGMAKNAFHRKFLSVLRTVALELGLTIDEFDVRSNKGGPAVLGEVTLHTDRLYLMVGGYGFEKAGDKQFMFRTVAGRKDYQGGANQWASMTLFEPFNRERLLEILGRIQKP